MEIGKFYIGLTQMGNRVFKYVQDVNGLAYGGFSVSNYTLDIFDIQFMTFASYIREATESEIVTWESWYNSHIAGE
jgi:hypothetical protein